MDDLDLLQAARGAVDALILEELLLLRAYLDQRIAATESEVVPVPPKAGRQVVAVAREGRITYQHELVRCGKPTCRCAAGQLHGPYWYRYYRRGRRLVSEYVGKQR